MSYIVYTTSIGTLFVITTIDIFLKLLANLFRKKPFYDYLRRNLGIISINT